MHRNLQKPAACTSPPVIQGGTEQSAHFFFLSNHLQRLLQQYTQSLKKICQSLAYPIPNDFDFDGDGDGGARWRSAGAVFINQLASKHPIPELFDLKLSTHLLTSIVSHADVVLESGCDSGIAEQSSHVEVNFLGVL